MSSNKRTGDRADTYPIVLRDAVRLARQIVRRCTNTKHLKGISWWSVALVARTASIADAVKTLVEARCGIEVKLLNRAMLDAVIDFYYITQTDRFYAARSFSKRRMTARS